MIDKRINHWVNKHFNRGDKRTVLITGGNSGIGFALAELLVSIHQKVIITSRNEVRGNEAINKIKNEYPDADISLLLLDLSKEDSIKAFTKVIIEKKIDINDIYHNAGIFRIPYQNNDQGYELTLATNYIGIYLFDEYLFPYLLSLNHEVHINFTTSLTTKFYKLNYDELNPHHEVGKMRSYARSKICVTHQYEYYLSQYKDTNLKFTLSHPGASYTPLIKKGYKGKLFRKLAHVAMKTVFHSPSKAALTYMYSFCHNVENNYVVSPRGLFELSGYPTLKKVKRRAIRNYPLTHEKTLQLLEK